MTKALESLIPEDVAALTAILRPIVTQIVQQGSLAQPYDIGFRFNSAPVASEILDFWVTSFPIVLPANLAGSFGVVNSTPVATYQMFLRLGGTLDPASGTVIATITISATGVFTYTTKDNLPVNIPAASFLKLVTQATQDIGIAGCAVVIRGGYA